VGNKPLEGSPKAMSTMIRDYQQEKPPGTEIDTRRGAEHHGRSLWRVFPLIPID